jgi:ABC-type nickel/cobalt efflux system permease component RcnA
MRELLPVLGIGLVIGFRHAFEPDHMAAVTTLAGRHARLREAWRLSLAWTAGHSATIALVTAAVIVLGWRLPARFWPACELAVALLLVGLGISVIVRTVRGRWHLHAHAHGGVPHVHVHSHAHGAGHEHVMHAPTAAGHWGSA